MLILYRCRNLEACAWILASLALGYFGNGEHDTVYVLRHHPSINMSALMVAGAMASANVLIFLYVHIWIRSVRRVSEDPELAAPWAIPVATISCLTCGISMMIACWGVWSWLTPIIGAVHFMGLIMLTNFLPTFSFKNHND